MTAARPLDYVPDLPRFRQLREVPLAAERKRAEEGFALEGEAVSES
jgi:hypothetical protein